MSKERLASESHQIIEAIAEAAGLLESDSVGKALEYFDAVASGDEKVSREGILPWDLDGDKKSKEAEKPEEQNDE